MMSTMAVMRAPDSETRFYRIDWALVMPALVMSPQAGHARLGDMNGIP
jgi:hypothetical protein